LFDYLRFAISPAKIRKTLQCSKKMVTFDADSPKNMYFCGAKLE